MGSLPWYEAIRFGMHISPFHWEMRSDGFAGYACVKFGPFSIWVEWPRKSEELSP